MIKKGCRLLLLGCFWAWFQCGCRKYDEHTVAVIPIQSYYEKITVNYSFHITLVQDTSCYIAVMCAEEFQKKLLIQHQGNALMLNSNLHALWLKGYPRIRLEIHLKELPYIEVFKPCSISIPDTFRTHMFYLVDWGDYTDLQAKVQVDFLRIDSSGDSFGTYQVEGSAVNADLYCRGSAAYDLSKLMADTCKAFHWSVSDMKVGVKHQLEATIYASGNIILHGNPMILLSRKGSGKVIILP